MGDWESKGGYGRSYRTTNRTVSPKRVQGGGRRFREILIKV